MAFHRHLSAELREVAPCWQTDEAAWLRRRHTNQPIGTITAEFLSRAQRIPWRQRWAVPATVIAWLLRRRSAMAVDSAYTKLRKHLQSMFLC